MKIDKIKPKRVKIDEVQKSTQESKTQFCAYFYTKGINAKGVITQAKLAIKRAK